MPQISFIAYIHIDFLKKKILEVGFLMWNNCTTFHASYFFYNLHPHELFLNFLMWDNYIAYIFLTNPENIKLIYDYFAPHIGFYSLHPHELFLNFSI